MTWLKKKDEFEQHLSALGKDWQDSFEMVVSNSNLVPDAQVQLGFHPTAQGEQEALSSSLHLAHGMDFLASWLLLFSLLSVTVSLEAARALEGLLSRRRRRSQMAECLLQWIADPVT